MEKKLIQNTILLGEYKEVDNLPLESIYKGGGDEILNGMILKGYETKFNAAKNENGEVFEKDCLNEFIEKYFVKNGLNMPVDIQHRDDIKHLAGRVLVVEVNSVGFYFVVYIPKTYVYYDILKGLIANKIIQGFSKCGWAVDYEYFWKGNDFDYMLIKKMEILSVSLVASPANGVVFEKAQEVKNATKFVNDNKKEVEQKDELDFLFEKE